LAFLAFLLALQRFCLGVNSSFLPFFSFLQPHLQRRLAALASRLAFALAFAFLAQFFLEEPGATGAE